VFKEVFTLSYMYGVHDTDVK